MTVRGMSGVVAMNYQLPHQLDDVGDGFFSMALLKLVERKLQRLGHFFTEICNDVPVARMPYETHADHLVSLPLA
jgi:hypothetical protein